MGIHIPKLILDNHTLPSNMVKHINLINFFRFQITIMNIAKMTFHVRHYSIPMHLVRKTLGIIGRRFRKKH